MLLLTKAKRPLKFKMLCGFNKHAVKLRMHKAAPYAFPIPLNTFWSYKSNNKGDIRQKLKIRYFMTPVWPIRGGGVKLTGYLDSPHMLSQYLLIHFEGIKATIKEI